MWSPGRTRATFAFDYGEPRLTPEGDATVDLAQAVLALRDARAPGASICPSDAVRVAHTGDGEGWRGLMDATRTAACRLADAGRVEITQRGQPVDLDRVRGSIRIRLRT